MSHSPEVTPKVTEELTRYVASLARLELSDQEVKTYTGQIREVLNYVDQLQELDVDRIEPLTHPLDLGTPMREDVVVPSPRDEEGRPKVLKSAPDVLEDGYKVPPIL